MNLKSVIRTIPDFPKPGIRFRDLTPLLADPAAFRHVIDQLADRYAGTIDVIAAIEARGFLFGAPLATRLGVGLVPVRKPGKLPAASIGHEYELEYGTSRVEIHTDALSHGERVLVVDDLLATGGTALAAIALVQQLGAHVVGAAFVVDLRDVGGRRRLESRGHAVFALCEFDEDE